MLRDINDPIARALVDLPSVLPRETHDDRVRTRCHTVLAKRRDSVRQPSRQLRSVELLMAAGVAVYVVAAITAAVRLL
jgi:hypothetical protein